MDERLSWPGWLTHSGHFYPQTGHMSTIDQAFVRESPPAIDRCPNHWATLPLIVRRIRANVNVYWYNEVNRRLKKKYNMMQPEKKRDDCTNLEVAVGKHLLDGFEALQTVGHQWTERVMTFAYQLERCCFSVIGTLLFRPHTHARTHAHTHTQTYAL